MSLLDVQTKRVGHRLAPKAYTAKGKKTLRGALQDEFVGATGPDGKIMLMWLEGQRS